MSNLKLADMKKFYSLISTFIAFVAMSTFIVCTAPTATAQDITFDPVQNSGLPNIAMGASLFTDVDNDGHPDIFLFGLMSPVTFEMGAKVFLNDGVGGFSELENPDIPGLFAGSAAFGDVNGDGYLDLVISGASATFQQQMLLFINNGEGGFTLSEDASFMGLVYSSLSIGDVNGDGYADILYAGLDIFTQAGYTILYMNNGDGTFTAKEDTPFAPLFYGKVELVDLNGDGHLDAFISGSYQDENAEMFSETNIYFNDGSGNFTLSANDLVGITTGGVDFADINRDGHIDIVLTGSNPQAGMNVSKLYLNDGSGNFTASPAEFIGFEYGDVAIIDVDGDGHKDILIGGSISSSAHAVVLYYNNGDGTFSEIENVGILSGEGMKFAVADINNDGALDLLTTRLVDEYPFTDLYLNTTEQVVGIVSNLANTVYAYPNPSNGIFNIVTEGNQLIEVYNLVGQKVYSKVVPHGNAEINLTDYPNGIYILRAGTQSFKLIKQ